MHPLLKDPLNYDIISILAVSNLMPLEKELWLAVLPDMTVKEKEELIHNLQGELQYEKQVSAQALEQFVSMLEKGA